MAAFRPGEALADYQQAYDLTHDPALLYNMARALEALEQYPEALRRTSPGLRTPRAARAPGQGAEARRADGVGAHPRVAPRGHLQHPGRTRHRPREDRPADARARGQALEVPLSSGRGVIEVDADGYIPVQRTVDLPGGGTIGVDIELVPRAVAGMLVGGERAGRGPRLRRRPRARRGSRRDHCRLRQSQGRGATSEGVTPRRRRASS